MTQARRGKTISVSKIFIISLYLGIERAGREVGRIEKYGPLKLTNHDARTN